MTAMEWARIFQQAAEWLRDPGVFVLGVIIAAVVLYHIIGTLISGVIRRTVRSHTLNSLTKDDAKKRQDTLISLFSTFFKFTIVIMALMMSIELLFPKIDFTPLFASAGIIGIALGFGAQSIIKDFLSGVFIIMENQYRVGDTVDIEGAAGTVERMTVRSTVLRDFDGNVHFLPNGTIAHVINKTMGFSKVNFSVTIDPENDIDKVIKIINEVGEKLASEKTWSKRIIDAPQFWNIGNFTDVSLDVTVVGKTQPSEQWSVTGELRRRLLREFSKQGVTLAHAPVGFSKKS
jgi:small conductance mechanosensitive channel